MDTLSIIRISFFMDMFAVAIIIPFFPKYFAAAGVQPAYYGLVSSVYGFFQIFGALFMGYLGDVIFGKKNAFLISLGGSAISYLLIGISNNIWVLVISRMLVGLVKHTQTISSAFVTEATRKEDRAKGLGHISALIAIAFIVGPLIGSILASYWISLPAVVASILFVANFAFIYIFLHPYSSTMDTTVDGSTAAGSASTSKFTQRKQSSKLTKLSVGYLYNMAMFVFTEYREAFLVMFFISMYGLAEESHGSMNAFYLTDQIGLPVIYNGYLMSWKSGLRFVVQGFLIAPLASIGEQLVVPICCIILCLTLFLQIITYNWQIYAFFILPIWVVTTSALNPVLKSSYTKAVPPSRITSALAVLNTVNSVIIVIAPTMSGLFFAQFGPSGPLALSIIYVIMLLIFFSFLSPEASKMKQQ